MQNTKAQSCSTLKTTLVQSLNIVGNVTGNRSEYTSPLFLGLDKSDSKLHFKRTWRVAEQIEKMILHLKNSG
jgi:hypothetical protein